jgi:DNA polymerase-4
MQIGIDYQKVNPIVEKPKGIGMSTTLEVDSCNINQLEKILLNLTEQVCFRLRKNNMKAKVVSVLLRTKDFVNFSHQGKMLETTNSSKEIFNRAKELLNEMYMQGTLIRLIGIRLDKLESTEEGQISIFELEENNKQSKIDKTIDELKTKYGFEKISRASDIDCKG